MLNGRFGDSAFFVTAYVPTRNLRMIPHTRFDVFATSIRFIRVLAHSIH